MRTISVIMAAALLYPFTAATAQAGTVDWKKIPSKTVTLFYPGQSTYQWLRADHGHEKARKQTNKGKACLACHEDDEEDIGNRLVAGKNIEPTVIPGKKGTLKLAVQAAHDNDNLYLRLKWKSQTKYEGRLHDLMRFDGKAWKWYGKDRSNKAVVSGEQPPIYEDRFALMIDDGSVPLFAKQGCWVTCHDSLRFMEKKPTADEVKAHPYLGAIKHKKDVRKYLPTTRTDANASWDKTKTPEEVAKIKAAGGFLDLMQWRVARSNAVSMADDGYVLEYRNFDAGKKMFGYNVDKKTMTPKFMFDSSKVGYKVLNKDIFGDASKPMTLISGVNTVAYDANGGFKEGDILPGRLLTTKTEGSAGDNDSAKGVWKDNGYTLVFTRKLNTGHPEDDKILKVGGTYTVGMAVHDDATTGRYHHVSFPLTLGLGVDADIKATTLK